MCGLKCKQRSISIVDYGFPFTWGSGAVNRISFNVKLRFVSFVSPYVRHYDAAEFDVHEIDFPGFHAVFVRRGSVDGKMLTGFMN